MDLQIQYVELVDDFDVTVPPGLYISFFVSIQFMVYNFSFFFFFLGGVGDFNIRLYISALYDL
jgi:hypothetical protein